MKYGAETFVSYMDSPVGVLSIVSDDYKLYSVSFGKLEDAEYTENETRISFETILQLEEYFEGTRQIFKIPMLPSGTSFQRKVWTELTKIPYGETRTYGEIAEAVGKPDGSRAVGMANNKNPIVIIVPCHRVIGANNALVGYGGGLEIKQFLLDLEAKYK